MSAKGEEKESTFMIECASTQNRVHVTGDLLRDDKGISPYRVKQMQPIMDMFSRETVTGP